MKIGGPQRYGQLWQIDEHRAAHRDCRNNPTPVGVVTGECNGDGCGRDGHHTERRRQFTMRVARRRHYHDARYREEGEIAVGGAISAQRSLNLVTNSGTSSEARPEITGLSPHDKSNSERPRLSEEPVNTGTIEWRTPQEMEDYRLAQSIARPEGRPRRGPMPTNRFNPDGSTRSSGDSPPAQSVAGGRIAVSAETARRLESLPRRPDWEYEQHLYTNRSGVHEQAGEGLYIDTVRCKRHQPGADNDI